MKGSAQEVSDSDFEQKVLRSDKPVIVDLWAPWCGPCMMFAPELERWAEGVKGKISVFELEIDHNPVTPRRLGITAIPTLVLFVNGREEERAVGIPAARTLLKKTREEWDNDGN